ncbi:MAG: 50S ribosomal protein L1 [Planctomycetes bacterium]|nr:50S ribosomal protein L1 [Planctomycetota bacterium]
MGKLRGKRYKAQVEKRPAGKLSLSQAVDTIKGFDAPKFDQTVELSMHLGIDPRQADQALRGSISLPNGIGVSRKVIAFCEGEDAEQAIEAGAIEAGCDELIEKIQGGWMDFDVALAKPDMMKKVSRLGRVLGPQGKMPSPKAGTVVEDVSSAVKEFVAGKVEYRNDEGGNLHVPVGKVSFESARLVENIDAFVSYIKKLRPPSAKGIFIRKACISATMSPSVELDLG